MQIQTRTMNWLPRASLYDEAEANRLKRKSNAQAAISQSSNATSLISGGDAHGEQRVLPQIILANSRAGLKAASRLCRLCVAIGHGGSMAN